MKQGKYMAAEAMFKKVRAMLNLFRVLYIIQSMILALAGAENGSQ